MSFKEVTKKKVKAVPNQYLLKWNNTPKTIHNPWLYAAVVLLKMGANSSRNM
jgi:hypothetical protein